MESIIIITPEWGSLWCFCFSFSEKYARNGEQAFSSLFSAVFEPTCDINDLNSIYDEIACIIIIIIITRICLITESFTCQC